MNLSYKKPIIEQSGVQNGGKDVDDPKVQMTALVTKDLHADQGTEKAARKPTSKQNRFGRAPTVLFGFSLVRAV